MTGNKPTKIKPTKPTPSDLVAWQDEYRKHIYEMCLWPAQWNTCDPTFNPSWQSVELDKRNKTKVPKETGIYSLLIQPGIANHSECSYLMYIGKTTSLRTRFGAYLTSERTGRPKVVRLLEIYADYIQFRYCKVDKALLISTEEQLFNAFVPPCNTKFTGKLQKAIGAFK